MIAKKKTPRKKLTRRRTFSIQKELTVCLIAGGAGFIGSYICEQLLTQNCFVYCLDNFSTGRKENITYLSSNPNFQVIDKDLNEIKKISLPKEPDYIFHLAGVEAYLNGVDVDLDTLLVNSFGTKNLLNLANETGAKFLLGSSIQVHTGYLSDSSLKNYFGAKRCNKGEGIFNEAKRFSEALTVEYSQKHGLNTRAVRLGFLYGPRMNLKSGNVLATLINQAHQKKSLTVFGNGLIKTYPTFISDAVYGLVKAMFSQSSKGRIYTLINPEAATLLNVAYALRDLTGENLEIEYVAGKDKTEDFLLETEILKSQEELGWYPKVNFKSGLGETLNWFKKQTAGANLVPARKKAVKKAGANLAPARFSVAKIRQTQSALLSFLKFKNQKSEKDKKKPNTKYQILDTKKKPARELTSCFFSLKTFFIIVIVSLFLLLFISSPFLLLGLFSLQGFKNLEKVNAAIEQKDWLEIKPRALAAKNSFIKGQKTLQVINSIFGRLGFSEKAEQADNLLEIGENIAQSIEHLWKAGSLTQELSHIILGQKIGDTKTLISQIQVEVGKANELLGFAQSQLRNEEVSFGKFNLDEKLKLLSIQIPQWRQGLSLAQTALIILPDFLSLEDKKTYLLLLQNNHELRPTGGFIGSYGLITFEKGKLLDFEIEDIYTADGQLKGHVEPPKEIKKYLGEATWFLRDSNFSPDFPTSAKRANWFLQKEMGRNVDGVIGINLYFIQNILKATGSILVPDYNEQITAENLFERAEYHSEVSFFPGSTQKKDFLGSLTTQLFEKLKTLQQHQLSNLALSFLNSFEQKAIMVWLRPTGIASSDARSNAKSVRALSKLGWDGALRTPPIGLPKFPQDIFPDFLMVNEANFGVNKVNFFVKRSVVQEITINGKTGEVVEKTAISIKNNSSSEAWPGGVYKNYLRLLLPAQSELISVKTSLKSNTLPQNNISLKKVDQSLEADKKSLGLLIEIPPKEERKVEIIYKFNQTFDLKKEELTYLFYWQKQSGIADDPIKLIINYPIFLKPTKLSQEAVLKEGSVSFDSTLEKDRIFAVAFGR